MSQDSTTIFDPFSFLKINELNANQKQQLRPPLLADIASFLIEQLVSTLPPAEAEAFLSKLEAISTQPFDILELLNSTSPSFLEKRTEYLEIYKNNFKLQKFIRFLV